MLIFQIESVDYTFILKSLYGVTVCSGRGPRYHHPLLGGVGRVGGHHNDFLLDHNPKLDLNPPEITNRAAVNMHTVSQISPGLHGYFLASK